MNRSHIRPPEPGETPLSEDEQWVAIREDERAIAEPKWHPEIVRNWSVASAQMHRKAAIAALSREPLSPARAFVPASEGRA